MADEVANISAKMSTLRAAVNRQISLLWERQQTLITAAVMVRSCTSRPAGLSRAPGRRLSILGETSGRSVFTASALSRFCVLRRSSRLLTSLQRCCGVRWWSPTTPVRRWFPRGRVPPMRPPGPDHRRAWPVHDEPRSTLPAGFGSEPGRLLRCLRHHDRERAPSQRGRGRSCGATDRVPHSRLWCGALERRDHAVRVAALAANGVVGARRRRNCMPATSGSLLKRRGRMASSRRRSAATSSRSAPCLASAMRKSIGCSPSPDRYPKARLRWRTQQPSGVSR